MKNVHQQKMPPTELTWLLFFYCVPSKPVKNRMKIWRILLKNGALPFKGSVYLLPYSDDHRELLQWLITSVIGMDGEADFVQVDSVAATSNQQLIEAFDQQREKSYVELERSLNLLIRQLEKGEALQDTSVLLKEFNRLLRDFQGVQRIDFFASTTGERIKEKFRLYSTYFSDETEKGHIMASNSIPVCQISDYNGKTWVTRTRPFVDRMASAWLIKTFIDQRATFGFVDEETALQNSGDVVTYDMVGADFTHIGDMTTFEVLLASFSLSQPGLTRIAQIVHQLDLNDDKYTPHETEGVRGILEGIRKTATDDAETLTKGMTVFDMLLAASA